MKRDETAYLQHILDALARIDRYIEGINERAFLQNDLV